MGAGNPMRRMFVVAVGVSTASIIAGTIILGVSSPAEALPSFARQTGQTCGTCHTDYPGLTPYGRLFKLNGYTTGGGKYRTTLFSRNDDSAKPSTAIPPKAPASGQSGTDQSAWVPPISMMAVVGYTHTQADQDPTGSRYHANDNVAVSPLSFFYGGAITDHIGAFAQVTYVDASFGALDPADPYASKLWTWDNTDVRYANSATLAGMSVIFGITGNNNPTVQDPWNTTPAWGFPYAASTIGATGPSSSTLIEGALAARVAGVGAYAWINNLVYLELTGYRAVNFDALAKLGTDPFGGPGVSPGMMDGIAPYWRVALEPHWGNHWLEFGAFGMSARVRPFTFAQDANGFYLNQRNPQSERYTDVGFDTQYQYQGDN